MSKVIFITGATGFVGRNMIPRLLKLENDSKLNLLIRGKSDSDVRNRFDKLVDALDKEIDSTVIRSRVSWVRGDISEKRLGLSECQFNKLAREITHIIHAAADVRFNLSLNQARNVNLNGTKNIIELASKARNRKVFQHLAYIGTAFISGKRKGIIYEDDLNSDRCFSNTYEQSKFEADCLVRASMKDLPITIFRPSIIVGDSKTGITSAFNVLYTPLKLISRGIIRYLPGSRRIKIDIVPVDFVCDSICHILFKCDDSIGKVYHLTAGRQACSTTGEVVKLSLNFFRSSRQSEKLKRVIFFPAFLTKFAMRFSSRKFTRIVQALKEYEPYLTIGKVFDNSNTLRALQDSGITVPPFREYYKELLNYCVATKWGKAVKYS